LLFVHLKKDLEGQSLNWVDCEDPQEAVDGATPTRPGVLTPYGIRKDVQERLAAIRTDLDSFSDKEAYALMTSGYRMTEQEMREALQHLFPSTAQATSWKFLAVEESMQQRDAAKELNRFLGVSTELFFKVWRLLPQGRRTAVLALLGAPLVAGFFWACWHWASVPLVTPGVIGAVALVLVAGFFVSANILRAVRFGETLTRIALGVGMSAFGCLLAQLHLKFFDPWFLRLGRVDSNSTKPGQPPT
jgi:hypothetical protein